jgi:hypothetical protein
MRRLAIGKPDSNTKLTSVCIWLSFVKYRVRELPPLLRAASRSSTTLCKSGSEVKTPISSLILWNEDTEYPKKKGPTFRPGRYHTLAEQQDRKEPWHVHRARVISDHGAVVGPHNPDHRIWQIRMSDDGERNT